MIRIDTLMEALDSLGDMDFLETVFGITEEVCFVEVSEYHNLSILNVSEDYDRKLSRIGWIDMTTGYIYRNHNGYEDYLISEFREIAYKLFTSNLKIVKGSFLNCLAKTKLSKKMILEFIESLSPTETAQLYGTFVGGPVNRALFPWENHSTIHQTTLALQCDDLFKVLINRAKALKNDYYNAMLEIESNLTITMDEVSLLEILILLTKEYGSPVIVTLAEDPKVKDIYTSGGLSKDDYGIYFEHKLKVYLSGGFIQTPPILNYLNQFLIYYAYESSDDEEKEI